MPADGLVSSTIPTLVNGVSQQPDELRLASQNEAQVNCLSDVIRGAGVRPPFKHVAKLEDDTFDGDRFYHFFKVGAQDKFLLALGDDEQNVWDLDGNVQSIDDSSQPTYMSSADPRSDFVVRTLEDQKTYIVNRGITVAEDTAGATTRPIDFVWTVVGFGASANDTATITIDSQTHTTSLSQTSIIGSRNVMLSALQGDGTLSAAGWTFTGFLNSAIYGVKTGSAPTTFLSHDTLNSTRTKMAFEKVQRFSDLPAKAPGGFLVEVEGDDTNDFDSFWVEFDDFDDVWRETVDPESFATLDPDTMPQIMAFVPSGSPDDFILTTGNWTARAAGDTTSNPTPAFVGRTIRALEQHAERLIFLAANFVIGSEARSYRNFYATTTTTLVDSDPIEVDASQDLVAELDFAIPFQKNLTLTSAADGYQGELVGGDRLTPATARVQDRGNFGIAEGVRPRPVGNAIFMPIDRDTFTGINEYTISDDVAVAEENTAHVPKFVPGNAFHMFASATDQILGILADDQPNRIYVYRWFNQGQDRLMSSWSYFETATGDIIRWADIIDSEIFIVVERSDGLYLEKMNLEEQATESLTYAPRLDSQVVVTGTYDSGTGLTTWSLPYDQTAMGGTYYVVRAGAGWADSIRGTAVGGIDVSTGEEITAFGDHSTASCVIGRFYDSSLTLSRFFIKESTNTGNRPVTTGRLQLKGGRGFLKDTGGVKVVVTFEDSSESFEYPYIPSGGAVPVTGPVSPKNGRIDFDIGGENRITRVSFQSTSWLPWSVTGLEWSGYYFRRGDRV